MIIYLIFFHIYYACFISIGYVHVCIYLFIYFFFYLFFLFFYFTVNMPEKPLSPLSEDGGQLIEGGNKVKGSHGERKLYGLFILPVIFIFAGIFCGYVRHMLFERVRRLIMMVDNHMLSVDQDIDMDQTPVKVLDTLNSLSTVDYDSSSDLLWDDSIERNAEDIIRNMGKDFNSEEGEDKKDKSDSSQNSIINIDFAEYFKIIDKIPRVNETDIPEESAKSPGCMRTEECIPSDPHRCSSPIDNSSHSLDRYESSPDHFPSFNVPIEDNSDEEGSSVTQSLDNMKRDDKK